MGRAIHCSVGCDKLSSEALLSETNEALGRESQWCPLQMNCLSQVFTGWMRTAPAAPAEEAADAEDAAEKQSLKDNSTLDFLSGISNMPGSKPKPLKQPAPKNKAVPAANNTSAITKCASETPIIAITVYMRDGDKAWVLSRAEALDQFGWWYRSQVAEFIRFGSRQGAQHTKAGGFDSILPDDEHSAIEYCIHGYCDPKGILVATMVTAPDYPAKVVYRLLSQLLGQFAQKHGALAAINTDTDIDFRPLHEALQKYQDPRNADRVPQLSNKIEETKEVLYKTIDQVLTRGQSLESMMEKSDDLSSSSMTFYKTSKKTRCCTILWNSKKTRCCTR